MPRAFEHRERILDVAEAAPATTWLEAAEALLDQQSAQARSDLSGGFADRSEARRQLETRLADLHVPADIVADRR